MGGSVVDGFTPTPATTPDDRPLPTTPSTARVREFASQLPNHTPLSMGAERKVLFDEAFETFMLTPIFLVSGTLSVVGLGVALVHSVEDKRWYWLFVMGGVWLWLVSGLFHA